MCSSREKLNLRRRAWKSLLAKDALIIWRELLSQLPNMMVREKQKTLVADLARFNTPQDRLGHIIRVGRAAAGLEEQFKTPETKLEGCLSNLWLRAEFRDGACIFSSDSDSAIVKGLATVICDLFSGLPSSEILRADLAPLRQAGLWQQLTPNRRTGLSRLVDKIHEFAREHMAE
jgi:cysteine desulfuration protein SufE